MKRLVKNQPWGRYQLILLIFMLVLVPIGLITKVYSGPAQEWVNGFSGDIFIEIFLIFGVTTIWPKASPAKVAMGVFLVSCAIEVLQLWKPPILQAFRVTLAGKLLLGTTFVWADFPHYFIGCLLGWLGLRYLKSVVISPKRLD